MIHRPNIRVLLMLGGPSREREVSLRSGRAVEAALSRRGYQVTAFDPSPVHLPELDGIDVVFLALHGSFGEDGWIQDWLEKRNVPFTGCDAASSRIAFNKVQTKEYLVQSKIRTPEYRVLHSNETAFPTDWTFPVVLKPVCEGSSVGLRMPETEAEWKEALASALDIGGEVLMEPKIRGREITVGILSDLALPIVEVTPKSGSYDYTSKYTVGATAYSCPAELEPSVEFAAKEAAVGAYRSIGCRDYARVDLMLDGRGVPWVLEVNTLPGMTETSLFPMAARQAGIGFDELCDRMLQTALFRSGFDINLKTDLTF